MPISITTAWTTSCRKELMKALHDFTPGTGDVFKIALIRASGLGSGVYGINTTNYSELVANGDEVANGSGYTTGGETLTTIGPAESDGTAFTDFVDVSWAGASFTASGALIYNSSKDNRAVAVLSFGGDYAAAATPFEVQFPAGDATSALLRIV